MPSKYKYFELKLHNAAKLDERGSGVYRPSRLHVSTYKICVHVLKVSGRKNVARQNAFAEPWRESFDLILYFLQHIYF